jgi:hypothetical protein
VNCLKIKCKCGNEGFLEKRGNSYRVKHYLRKAGNQRKYTICRLTPSEAHPLDNVGNHTQMKTPNFAVFCQKKVNLGTQGLAVNQSVKGSNPFDGAILAFRSRLDSIVGLSQIVE